MKKIKMINNVYNDFLVLEELLVRRNKKIYYKCKCLKCNNILEAEGGHIRKQEILCPFCGIKGNYKNIKNQKFGKLTAIKPTNERSFNSIIWICKCECGNVKKVSLKDLTSNLVKSCGCLNKSVGEENIQSILIENKISFKRQFSFSRNKKRRYDFALLNEEKKPIRLIEFDGEQHFGINGDLWFKSDSYLVRKNRDEEKNIIAKSEEIPLVRIPYWERNKITLEMILGGQYEI